MTPLNDAVDRVLGRCARLPVVTLDRAAARGLVLADAVTAAELVPPFDNSAVDGYAVRSVDVDDAPVDLDVVGELAAGTAPTVPVGPGQAIRIMTGAPIPAGADAVVMVEHSERLDGERVRLSETARAGQAIRVAGDDVRVGDLLFAAGTVVTPPVEAVLASVNVSAVAVVPRARVAVLSTGDELVDDGRPLEVGEIRESNRTMLAGMLAETGCEVVDLGIVRDDEAALEQALRDAAASCDAIVTSGGVSMGDYDVVKAVLGRIADMTWMQLAIKPAKPFAFGTVGGTPVFGLPGNPVSSLVSFEVLARPALRQMMGLPPRRPVVRAITDTDLVRAPDGKLHLLRVTAAFAADGRVHIAPVAAQGSHQLAATALADALVWLPDGDGVGAGAEVDLTWLRDPS